MLFDIPVGDTDISKPALLFWMVLQKYFSIVLSLVGGQPFLSTSLSV
jgi:hypothetical protein